MSVESAKKLIETNINFNVVILSTMVKAAAQAKNEDQRIGTSLLANKAEADIRMLQQIRDELDKT